MQVLTNEACQYPLSIVDVGRRPRHVQSLVTTEDDFVGDPEEVLADGFYDVPLVPAEASMHTKQQYLNSLCVH